MKRTKRMARRGAVGRASRARIRRGGPLSKRRGALSQAGLSFLREWLLNYRAHWRSEFSGHDGNLQLEHAVPRSAGGKDEWSNVWISTAEENERKHWPFSKGRLLVTPHGDGTFTGSIVFATSKQAYLAGDCRVYRVEREVRFGRPMTPHEEQIMAALR